MRAPGVVLCMSSEKLSEHANEAGPRSGSRSYERRLSKKSPASR